MGDVIYISANQGSWANVMFFIYYILSKKFYKTSVSFQLGFQSHLCFTYHVVVTECNIKNIFRVSHTLQLTLRALRRVK